MISHSCFYANERDEQVGIREEELSTLVRTGTIRPDTLIWIEGMADWTPCRIAKPELFAAVPMPPTLPYRRPPAEPTEGLAVASLVLGICGLIFMCCYFVGVPLSISAVICGHVSRSRLRVRGGGSGEGVALAGLITGYVGLSLVGILVIVALAGSVAPNIPLTPEAAP